MLGDNLLNKDKQVQISKSQINTDEIARQKLIEMLEEKNRTIRKLTGKINKHKLEENSKKSTNLGDLKSTEKNSPIKNNYHLDLLQREIAKTEKLELIIEEFIERINSILLELSQENSLTDNSQQLREMLKILENEKSQEKSISYSSSVSNHQSINLSSDWNKKLDSLDIVIKSFRIKFSEMKLQNKKLEQELGKYKSQYQTLVDRHEEDTLQIRMELKQERKQRQKLKGLLQKTEIQKNQIINKINLIEVDAKAKTREQLIEYSKELKFKIKNLQEQKQDFLKTSTKDKQSQLRKYQDLLLKVKGIKDKSKYGKSFA